MDAGAPQASSSVGQSFNNSCRSRFSTVVLVPIYGFGQTITKLRRSSPPELGRSARSIQAAPRLSVGLSRIPADRSLKTDQQTNPFEQIANTDFFTRAHVDGF